MVNFKEDKELMPLNHSCAHVMAQAVKHLFPNAKFWVGPVVEEGFYYDMDLGDKVLTEDDIEAISKEMKKIIKDGKRIVRQEISREEALAMFKEDPYKIDLINNMDDSTLITCYSQGDYTDLCRGPHVDTVKECKYFKLIKFSGAYWKGDAKNKMLQRVYGVCFKTEEDLNKTSGQWDHYQENMFPKMKVDEEEFVLRPMNCPHHMLVYGNDIHSYKELPIRIGEFATDFRYEASGAVKGLERVRCMCQNDAHLFVRPDQIGEEFKKVVSLILDVYHDFGITDYKFRLSLRDKEDKEKYFDDDDMWNEAESKLRDVLNELGVEYFEAIGEAAFYGPKLDVEVKPAVGPEITLSTCQLDFLLPRRFNLSYIDNNGEKQIPIVLHRAIFGTFDRFTAFILEETKGALPLWLSPTQIKILPVNNEYHLDYAKVLFDKLNALDLRVNLDDRDEKVGYRMREAVISKTPITLIIGQKEVDEKTVSYRLYGSDATTTVSYEEFVKYIEERLANHQ